MISVTKNQVCFPLFSNLSLLPNSQLTNRIGKNDLISIPKEIYTEKAIGENPWPGFKSTPERRRYSIQPNDSRTAEGKNFIFTPYADTGNDGAAFRTIFPLTAE
ncbi:MAG: hypothetical protein ACJ0Q6_04925 [Candidatus Azotimanducaceae bacterium]|uniref:Uncharacterized protein n=1 Tax=OM182 bacterium TaxID=2510334 RepID=A0A520RZ10_9GAMM|nr:hypothetical protein [Gammaproteobacteria bacterium]OUV67339.1 MAG: hypothetical protein CBC93_05725 [Gammaproteobacteria bacterium TMED133]RZO75437.1 MAG: hypothetical protein EVA68_07045 [OM182 bacterium]